MRRRTRKALIGVLLLLLLAAGAGLGSGGFGEEGTSTPADAAPVAGPPLPAGAREVAVERVVDGDTVELAGLGKARIIGVDTPEVYGGAECFGREASAFAKRQLDGVLVSYTVGREERDRYGRLLVYLWLPDGRSFNALLADRGYATPLTIPPNDDFAERFVALGRRAREAGRGLWAKGACG
jgi:micrococcal nuclease